MAIKIYEKFAPRANPADGDHPYGSIKNESVPGAKDGTPLDAEWGNDMVGFTDALLSEAGIVPSGNPDTVIESQRLNALNVLNLRRLDSTTNVLSKNLTGVKAVATEGYDSRGDGGGASWLSTGNLVPGSAGTTDLDNGLIYDSEGNEFKYNFKDVVITHFGASIAAADNGPALQSAVNYALSKVGTTVICPPGIYLFTTGVVAAGEAADRLTMVGAARRGTEFRTNSAIDILTLSGEPANTFQYPTLHRLSFNANNAGANGVKTRNTELMRITECVFLGSGGIAGVNMSPVGGDSDIKPLIHDNVFGGGLQHGILGGDTRQADGSYKDNYFIDVTVSCVTMGWPDGGTFTGNKMFSNAAGGNSVNGFNLKRPVYCFVEDNDFFELGGIALLLTTPRYSRFNNNRFVNVGQAGALNAISVLDFNASVPGEDVQFVGNTLKDINGAGLVINSANSLQSRYTIEGNFFLNVGESGTIYDAIQLTNCDKFELLRNRFKSTQPTNKTRYWANLNNVTNLRIQGNTNEGLQNKDVNRTGTVTMLVEDSRNILLDVTATTNIRFDDDGVIGGNLPASITLNLPAANSCPGKVFTCRWTAGGAFSIILDPASTQTIDGSATLNVNSGNPKVTIISDGANWLTL